MGCLPELSQAGLIQALKPGASWPVLDGVLASAVWHLVVPGLLKVAVAVQLLGWAHVVGWDVVPCGYRFTADWYGAAN